MRLPLRLWLLVIVPLLIAGASYVAYSWINSKIDRKPESKPAGIVAANDSAARGGAPGGAAAVPSLTPAEYVKQFRPRVPDLAFSAPIYDPLTVPKSAPFPVGCVASEGSEARAIKASCRCYTEQGTRLDVSAEFCQAVAERGYFQFWKDATSGPVPASQSNATNSGVVSSTRL